MEKITNFFKTRLCLNIFLAIIILWLITNGFKFDPFPYQFASTVTNFLGFLLMIIVNIAISDQEKKHHKHAEAHKAILENHKIIIENQEQLKRHLSDLKGS